MANRIQPPSAHFVDDRGLLVTAARASELSEASAVWPSWTLTPQQACHVELMGSGALAPLRGFMGRSEHEAIKTSRQPTTGAHWPVPIVLGVSDAFAAQTEMGAPVALRDREGVLLAALWVDEVWSPDGPSDSGEPQRCLAGRIEVIEPPLHYDFQPLRRTPRQVRQEVAARGWTDVTVLRVGASAGLPGVADAVASAQAGDRLLMHAVVGPIDIGDAGYYARIRELRTIAESAAGGNVMFSIRPQASFEAGSRARLLEDIVDANYGSTRVVLPADALDSTAAARSTGGVTVFLTGLSGSGKSTIANVLLVRMLERGGRSVTLLDGDLVRTHLSTELGFSREHRNINVRRIGFVAAEITKHGGIAICAPIAPYDHVRKEVRAMVEAVGGFVLVHVATPLAVCEARDRKGLYAKARAGLLKEFTGVSDPYDVPSDAEIVVNTTNLQAEAAADLILDYLERRGRLDAV